ncbi:MAG TPA: S26 family signal peptidase [Acidimicrobiales bacterium]|nr:S26 family signal peptidase [Acidimicrobiales bacterium]
MRETLALLWRWRRLGRAYLQNWRRWPALGQLVLADWRQWPARIARLPSIWRQWPSLLRRLIVASVVAAAAAWAAAGIKLLQSRLLRLQVEGLSMVPTLGPGDRILVLRTKHLAIGDIVAFPDPDQSERLMVKRVTGVEWNAVKVEGDNTAVSRDSRHFGSVPLADVTGRVLWCYWSPYRSTLKRASGDVNKGGAGPGFGVVKR